MESVFSNSRVNNRWSFNNTRSEQCHLDDLNDCNDGISCSIKNLLEKDVISAKKLQSLVSEDEPINPALIMQLRSNSVRPTKENRPTSAKSGAKLRQEEAIKKNEKRRQMVLVNREILKLNKEFDEKQKVRMKETKTNGSVNKFSKYRSINMTPFDQVANTSNSIASYQIPNCINNSKITFTSNDNLQKNHLPCRETFLKKDINPDSNQLYVIENDISLIIDCFNKNGIELTDDIERDEKQEDDTYAILTSTASVSSQLEKKYFNIWIQVVQKRKNNAFRSEVKSTRTNEVDRFFKLLKHQKRIIKKHEKISEKNQIEEAKIQEANEKATIKDNPSEFSSFRHRYFVQKNVIALQKCKLEEQNRIIEELKLKKIEEATKQSLDQLKDEVRESYQRFARDNKPRVKCLANEAEVETEEIEENPIDLLQLHCLKVPKFIQKMEQRAKEREEKHAVIRERRRQMEEEQKRLKLQAELLRAEMDEEEKRRRIEELREKRRAEKMEKIRRRKEQERSRALMVMADLHYETKILHNFIDRWRCEVRNTKEKIKLAKQHRTEKLKRKYLNIWKRHTDNIWQEYYAKANNFYRYKLLDKAMSALKMNSYEVLLNKQVADDWYDLHLLERMFRQWHLHTVNMKELRKKQWDVAGTHYESKLLWNAWCSWRTLPAINALKREQELRKMKWRQKVLQVIPDYTPPEDF